MDSGNESDLTSTEVTTIHQLLPEILQEIFNHLDGKSLVICKRVCQEWRSQIDNVESKSRSFWYDICQREIPSWVQLDLLDSLFPAHWKNRSCVNWEDIYGCWIGWNATLKKESSPLAESALGFPFKLNGISSIQVSGCWLLISTYQGRGKLCAQNMRNPDIFVDLYIGGNAILGFELVVSDRKPASTTTEPLHKLKEDFFDSIEHNEIWLEMKNNYVQLGRGYCINHDKTQQRIRHSYGYQLSLVNNGQNSVINLMKICNTVPGPELMEVELPRLYTNIQQFWTNKVSLTIGDPAFHTRLPLNIETFTIDMKSQDVSSIFNGEEDCLRGETYKVHSWHNYLHIFFSNKRCTTFQKRNKAFLKSDSATVGAITAAFVHTDFIWLGTERGQVLVYCMRVPANCSSEITFNSRDIVIQLCHSKIIDITVAGPKAHGGKKPMILCASAEQVFKITTKV